MALMDTVNRQNTGYIYLLLSLSFPHLLAGVINVLSFFQIYHRVDF